MRNVIITKGDLSFIVCKKLGVEVLVTIDTESVPMLAKMQVRWFVSRTNPINQTMYVVAAEPNGDGTKSVRYLHRVITNCPEGKVVNHRNGDGLNNRVSNLQVCTQQENVANCRLSSRTRAKSGHRNVCQTPNGKYAVKVAGKYLGRFETLDRAVVVATARRMMINTFRMRKD